MARYARAASTMARVLHGGTGTRVRARGTGRACVRDVSSEHECSAQLRSDHRRRIATWDRLRLVAVDPRAARGLALGPKARAAARKVLHREMGARSSQACAQIRV